MTYEKNDDARNPEDAEDLGTGKGVRREELRDAVAFDPGEDLGTGGGQRVHVERGADDLAEPDELG